MRTFLIAAYLNELFLNNRYNKQPLVTWASLKKFLTEIIAIIVDHKFAKILGDLIQKELDSLTWSFLKLLLKESTTSLFQGKFVNISSDYFKLLRLILAFFKLFDDLLH
jgi:hypothetical protein